VPSLREEIIEACSEAAHDAWLAEKTERLRRLWTVGGVPVERQLSWPSETGEEQLVPWSELSEPVRDFDRIVVSAIYDMMEPLIRQRERDLAVAIISLAEDAGMPDTYKESDSRMRLARETLES
jgi:hypothetical protein